MNTPNLLTPKFIIWVSVPYRTVIGKYIRVHEVFSVVFGILIVPRE